MNPPYTNRRRLSSVMKSKIKEDAWWGKERSLDLWTHFLFLASDLLKTNGKIGAVLPLGFLIAFPSYD